MAAFSTIALVAVAAISAAAAVQQGQAAKKQAGFTAAVQRQQATRERQVAASNERDFRRQQSRLMASRRAVLGASGVESGTGSTLLATEDFAAESELQALKIRAGGETNATRLEQSAQLQAMRGDAAATGGFMRAGSLLVSGGGKAFGGAGVGVSDPHGLSQFETGV